MSEGEDALLAFRSVYIDPLEVNGAQTALRELVDRARMLQRAFEGLHAEILERFDSRLMSSVWTSSKFDRTAYSRCGRSPTTSVY